MQIKIDGDTYEVEDWTELGYDGLMEIDCGSESFVVAVDSETAGRASRERWSDMAKHDPAEFRTLVGDETLTAWCLGQNAGPGTTKVSSLEAWLDLHLDVPEEEWAGYDSTERDVETCPSELSEALGFTPTVAYRSN